MLEGRPFPSSDSGRLVMNDDPDIKTEKGRAEILKDMDATLRRMLNSPPKPHRRKPSSAPSPEAPQPRKRSPRSPRKASSGLPATSSKETLPVPLSLSGGHIFRIVEGRLVVDRLSARESKRLSC